MIDRPSRDRLAEALRHYVSGRITNDELDAVEVDWRDRGVVAVHEMAWHLYDDLKVHYVEDRLPRHSEARRGVASWIVFLHSDTEYFWPEYSFIQVVNWPMNLLTLGWWERRKQRRWQRFQEAGDFAVWPFFCRSDLESARARPRLLAGRGSSVTVPSP